MAFLFCWVFLLWEVALRREQSGRKEVDGVFLVTHLVLFLAKANELEDQSHLDLRKELEPSTEHDGGRFMVECVCAKSRLSHGF